MIVSTLFSLSLLLLHGYHSLGDLALQGYKFDSGARTRTCSRHHTMATIGEKNANLAPALGRRGRPRTKKKTVAELSVDDVRKEEKEVTHGENERVDVDDGAGDGLEPKDGVEREEADTMSADDADEGSEDWPKPLGSPIGSPDESGPLYGSFEFDGKQYELEDAVMVSNEDIEVRPGVAIIKVKINDDPRWSACDPRQLLFTDHQEEVPAETILYKCVVHFLPSHKQLPDRRVHPGFVVQHFYDYLKQRVISITDKGCCKGSLQKEIHAHLRETELSIGYVSNVDKGDNTAYPKQFEKNDHVRKGNTSTVNDDEEELSPGKQGLERPSEQISPQQQKVTTPRSHAKNPYTNILALFGLLTGNARRDKNLERLLEGIHSQWNFIKNQYDDGQSSDQNLKVIKETVKSQKGIRLIWPDSVIGPIFSLEDETDAAYGSDSRKYNQKMKKLVFNLTKNGILAKRFVTQELAPSKLLNMSPDELKNGFMTEELPRNESDGKQEMQMVDARCKICSEKKVFLKDVIMAGHRQRYQLECSECGRSWFTSVMKYQN
uniref:TFIIS central domain-containing protein n=1 Tax=Kalanchoe fedtschenkoi TaxID=63787 RepID=A0A7N0RBE7_KALFE